MNIGITCFPTYGGSGIVATEIGLAMARRGHRVHFVCSDLPIRLPACERNIWFHEVRAAPYPLFNQAPYALALASRLVEVAKWEALDLLHVHYAVPHATSAVLARQILGDSAIPIVTTLHGTDITLVGAYPSYLPITRFSIAQSDAVTVPSTYLAERTDELMGEWPPKRPPLEVIPNFVDTQRWRPSAPRDRARLAAYFPNAPAADAATEPVVVHVSNFRPVKRPTVVVDIFHRVNMQRAIRLLLLGDGPERSRVETEVRARGLTDRVAFLGKQDRFEALLADCDVFLLPSASESFGLAALEAQSCGVPVVASLVGGLPEVIAHGQTGLLAPADDIDALAAHVVSLVTDHARAESLGLAGRARAEERFAQAPIIDRYESLYRRVTAGEAP